MSSWAAKLDPNAAPGPPTPEDRLRALRGFYATRSPKTILAEALGNYTPMLSNTPEIAKPLVEHTIVICVDTESHTLNTDQMTELGLNYISRKKAKEIGMPGPHGWKLQEALNFLHFRVAEHAHLKSNRVDSLGPLGNRFGHTRFSTFGELRVILHHLFNQEIETEDPKLKGCKCPIVLVGHALKHDTENTNKRGLEYSLDNNITVVAKVDTQALAREVGVWTPAPNMHTNEIGLRTMIETLGFLHLDDHTAGNDAARTMMCAIHMVLPAQLRNVTNPSMQAVAIRVETNSKFTSPAIYGTVECCTRCGGRNHSSTTCTAPVRCAACSRFDVSFDREAAITSHIETYCPHVATFKAWARRYRDAAIKNRKPTLEVAAGPGGDAHPWSTWPRAIKWPLVDLKDVLVGFNMVSHDERLREPPAAVEDLDSALGGLSMPGVSTADSTVAVGNGLSKTLGASLPPPSTGLASSAFPPLPPPPTGPAARSQPVASRRSTGTPTARKATTMSEQRERAGLAPGQSKRGGKRSLPGRGGFPDKPGGGGAAGGAAAVGSWW